MIGVTGANGRLGQLVVAALLKRVPASQVVALVRTPEKAADLAAKGVVVRRADYDQPATLDAAFAGITHLLLISSSEVGKRDAQHKAVIAAAKKAGVKLLAYTSILHADTSIIGLAEEHRQTERAIRESGVPFTLLRNGWYLENYTGGIAGIVAGGSRPGCAANARIAAAARADYAEAAAVVLTSGAAQAGRVYELAGDHPFTLAEFVAEIAKQTGKPLTYRDMSAEDYATALVGVGLPPPIAKLLSNSESAAAKGALFDEGHQLSTLIGRPTTSLADAVRAALQG